MKLASLQNFSRVTQVVSRGSLSFRTFVRKYLCVAIDQGLMVDEGPDAMHLSYVSLRDY
jgi:hypothetical protein